MQEKSASELLDAANDLYGLAEEGLKNLGDPSLERRLAGLRNLVVFGRASMLALSSLRRKHPGFDDWFEQNWAGLRADPLVADFEVIREDILRGAGSSAVITQLMVKSAGKSYGTPPKGARAFFTGDRLGGTGWELVLPDGTVEKYYVVVSEAKVGSARFRFRDQGAEPGRSIEEISKNYIAHLREMVRSAREYFA